MIGRVIQIGWLAGLAASLIGGAAAAQVVSPMLQDTVALGPIATARFEAANPYEHSQRSEFFIVDSRGAPIASAFVSPARSTIAPGGRVAVMVQVPMDGRARRTVYVCHAIEPRHPNAVKRGTSYRGEVCAKLVAIQQSPQ